MRAKGVKRGYIADTEVTELDVRDAVEQAERIAGTNIDDVWVSFSAGGLTSMLTSVETELGGHRIEQEDIDLLLDAGRNSIDPQRQDGAARTARYVHVRRTKWRQETKGSARRSTGRRHSCDSGRWHRQFVISI